MAEVNDILALQGRNGGMTPFESFMVAEKTSKRPSNAAVAGLVLGSVGAAAAIGAWIFSGTYSSAKSNGVAALAAANHENTERTIDRLATLLAQERNERVNGDINLTNTVNDTLSGSQQGTLSAQQQSELSSIQNVEQNLLNQAILGNLSQAPQKVAIYQDAMPCGCGCGNN